MTQELSSQYVVVEEVPERGESILSSIRHSSASVGEALVRSTQVAGRAHHVSRQIARSMEQISLMTDSGSASARASRQQAAELTNVAHQLAKAVDQFQI